MSSRGHNLVDSSGHLSVDISQWPLEEIRKWTIVKKSLDIIKCVEVDIS